jgi:hypothetical protein
VYKQNQLLYQYTGKNFKEISHEVSKIFFLLMALLENLSEAGFQKDGMCSFAYEIFVGSRNF